MKTAFAISTDHEKHQCEGHFERPERIHAIRQTLEETEVWKTLNFVTSEPATKDDILLVHSSSFYEQLIAASNAGNVWLDQDTYSTPDSFRIATEALGALLEITRQITTGQVDNGFAAVRPPGHHARPSQPMGFCLLANAAIAARWIQTHTDFQRIAIVDYDVHHGNGTQEVFYDDPDVLYISTHQHPLYPGTGALEETGTGKGEGSTINVPLPAQTGDDLIGEVFEHILRPRVLEFAPEFIILSAGYDAHWMDPIGGMNLSLQGFSTMTREILYWASTCANNRLVGLLEGGYNLEALSHGVRTTVQLFSDSSSNPHDPIGKHPGREDFDKGANDYFKELTQFHKH